MSMLTLNTPINDLNRIGSATAKKLARLDLKTAADLLFYFPFRYDDFSKVFKINELQKGMTANIVGQIEFIQNKRSFRRRMMVTEALINDHADQIKVIWFNQPFIGRNLKPGDHVSLAGKVEEDFSGLIMVSPAYEKIAQNKNAHVHTQGLVPNYHLTGNLTNKQLRFLIKQIINLAKDLNDWLPAEIIKKEKLISLNQAIAKIHFPKTQADITAARARLAFNELFLLQLQSQLLRQENKLLTAMPIKFKERNTKEFVDQLPFKLTNSQRRAAWEIIKDLAQPRPMMRLLEGDVGSGKTIVAVIAMLNIALNGQQAALMVPTEILARQHYENIKKLLKGFDIKIGLVTSSDKRLNCKIANEKKIDSQSIIQKAQIIIGTHALIQKKINFSNLVLAIIDEQHRFGVEQREALIGKVNKTNSQALSPHLLSMTATPIPRSLALAIYGDLDLSIINELPAGRKKIATHVVPEAKRQAAYQFIRQQIQAGRQVFVICPLIDPSDKLGVKSAKEEFEKLDKLIFPEIKISLLHGRLKPKDKEETMKKFLEGGVKILVATSVVEVGVDVTNATIMMIEGADRFGLAQLHQFRGRVGRSEHQSYCFLFTESQNDKTLSRLNALTKHFDGFTLSKIDLKFRGPGEVYGTAQAGFPELKIASLFDYALMKKAQQSALKLITEDQTLNSWPSLREEVINKGGYLHRE